MVWIELDAGNQPIGLSNKILPAFPAACWPAFVPVYAFFKLKPIANANFFSYFGGNIFSLPVKVVNSSAGNRPWRAVPVPVKSRWPLAALLQTATNAIWQADYFRTFVGFSINLHEQRYTAEHPPDCHWREHHA
jgi:hypothetical protein